MKKILFLLAITFATLTSCSTDETTSSKPQTGSVAFSIDQPSASTTGKQIKRGNIPVWVNTISITATSNAFAPYASSDNFTFDQQNGASLITLDNVAVGSNTFTATTTTDSPQKRLFTNQTVNSGNNDSKFTTVFNSITENPYVLYTGTTNSNIAQTGVNTVTIPMTTQNGRIIGIFQLSDAGKAITLNGGLQAKITATIAGLPTQTAITKGNELVFFNWSDANSVKDKTVNYTIEISHVNSQSTILKTLTASQTVLASTSLSCYYTVDIDGIVFKRNDVGITLNWQEWKNAQCPTGDCFN
jgi:hypothetical protein